MVRTYACSATLYVWGLFQETIVVKTARRTCVLRIEGRKEGGRVGIKKGEGG